MPTRNRTNMTAKAPAEAASAALTRTRRMRAITCGRSLGVGRLLHQIPVPGLGEVGRRIDLVGIVAERLQVHGADAQARALDPFGDLLLVVEPRLVVERGGAHRRGAHFLLQ